MSAAIPLLELRDVSLGRGGSVIFDEVRFTVGVNAANLAVDFWRRAYMLNYEVLQVPGNGIPAFTEPSVSLWLPTPPTF